MYGGLKMGGPQLGTHDCERWKALGPEFIDTEFCLSRERTVPISGTILCCKYWSSLKAAN